MKEVIAVARGLWQAIAMKTLLLGCGIQTLMLVLGLGIEIDESEEPKPALVSTLNSEALKDFDQFSAEEKKLIEAALALTRLNLTYMAASHDPAKGGMDCSGAIYYLLHSEGFKSAPRQSNQMGQWVIDKGLLHHASKARSVDDPALSHLQPGDLLFWTGTYEAEGRETLPITHVMLFLGWRKTDGKPLIFGSSDGRRYAGQSRRGVSVFDFELPRAESKAQFFGYGRIPGFPKGEVQEEIRKAEL